MGLDGLPSVTSRQPNLPVGRWNFFSKGYFKHFFQKALRTELPTRGYHHEKSIRCMSKFHLHCTLCYAFFYLGRRGRELIYADSLIGALVGSIQSVLQGPYTEARTALS